MPLNPSAPPKRTEPLVTGIRRNQLLVAFLAGQLSGIGLVLLTRVVA